MDPREAVESYYAALRAGDPLSPYFADRETTVKFGISETLAGGVSVAEGLAEQTERTTDWTVRSRELVCDRSGAVAWFADDVFMAWTDTERRIRYEFDTRWSGTLLEGAEASAPAGGWRFVGMHVSVPGGL